MDYYDLLIIGAGPGGLFTAINSAGPNIRIGILEKKARPARKLLLTGGGQCNLTHSGDIRDFYDSYGDNHRFLRAAFNEFDNYSLMDFFESRGLRLRETDEGKIFPLSGKAQDVLDLLIEECRDKDIDIFYNEPAKGLALKDDSFLVEAESKTFKAKALVIATGGKSYPHTGSTGDGYNLASSLGHLIIGPKPALTPLHISDFPLRHLSGISFDDIETSLWRNNRKIKTFRGDVLLTHRGLSGPSILNSSRYIEPGDILKLNLLAFKSFEESREFLDAILIKNGRRLIKNAIREYDLPERLLLSLLDMAQISEEERCAHIDRKHRNRLAELLYNLPLTVDSLGGFNIAMVTKGGINLKEINPSSMESRLIPRLFFVGEILDIDGDTGGYNLQAVFSEAYLAARHINKLL